MDSFILRLVVWILRKRNFIFTIRKDSNGTLYYGTDGNMFSEPAVQLHVHDGVIPQTMDKIERFTISESADYAFGYPLPPSTPLTFTDDGHHYNGIGYSEEQLNSVIADSKNKEDLCQT